MRCFNVYDSVFNVSVFSALSLRSVNITDSIVNNSHVAVL